jgi:uncharacterized protein with GYD domain
MPKYISLCTRTDKGVSTIAEAVERAKSSHEYGKSLNSSFELYMTNGPYDMVAIVDVPDDNAAFKFKLAIESRGYLRMLSMRAFTESEFAGIASGL